MKEIKATFRITDEKLLNTDDAAINDAVTRILENLKPDGLEAVEWHVHERKAPPMPL